MSAEQENSKVPEKVGRSKVLRALNDVSTKLNPEEDLRPLFDRAYELGYKPGPDGGIDLNTELMIGGQECHGLIDTKAAMDVDTAVALGYLDADEAIPARLNGATESAGQVEDEAGTVAPQNIAPGTNLYRWRGASGQNVYIRNMFGTHYTADTFIKSLAVWTPPSMAGSLIARTYYRTLGINGSHHWSIWRRGVRGAWSYYYFDSMVRGSISQVERD